MKAEIITTRHTDTPWINAGQCVYTGDYQSPIALLPDVTEPARWLGRNYEGPTEKDNSQHEDKQKANAEHIVKCVNAHDELVDACKSALSMIKNHIPGEHGNPEIGKAWGKLEYVLRIEEVTP